MFKMESLGEYHDSYLKTDVPFLCDMFEKFINACLADYGLYPYRYYSSPGRSWDAMLKTTGVKLEKIDNIDIHLFLGKGMRVGVSYIPKRYSKSTNDTNIEYLPYGSFRFLSEEEIKVFDLDVILIPENSLIGYIIEVDLEYPEELHDLHSDYPLCPEKIEVSYEMLSKYCKHIVNRYGIRVGGVKKLIPNHSDKVRYHVHYKNLLYYLSLGMKLVKIHRILSFKQSNFLKVFTVLIEKRQKSPDEFSKNLCKLLSNCIYGKSIENIRKTISVQ